MGESDSAMEYDQDFIFKHLSVHLSLQVLVASRSILQMFLSRLTRQRTQKWNGGQIQVGGRHKPKVYPVQWHFDIKTTISLFPSFAELQKTITDNGGRVVDLQEPKLTHVVLDKRDDSRRLELMNRTSQ
jgi:DNA ligase 4